MHKWELITVPQCSLTYRVYSLKLSLLRSDWMSCFFKWAPLKQPKGFGFYLSTCLLRQLLKKVLVFALKGKNRNSWERNDTETMNLNNLLTRLSTSKAFKEIQTEKITSKLLLQLSEKIYLLICGDKSSLESLVPIQRSLYFYGASPPEHRARTYNAAIVDHLFGWGLSILAV